MKRTLASILVLSASALSGCDFGISYFSAAPPSQVQSVIENLSAQVDAKTLDIAGTAVYDLSDVDQISSATVNQTNTNFILNSDYLVVLNTTPSPGLSTDFVIQTPTKTVHLHVALSMETQTASVPMVWGRNQNTNVLLNGQSGIASPSPQLASVSTLAFKQISSSRDHSCGLTADGTAYCWGEGSYGQLGANAQVDSSTPLAVQTTLKFKSIAVAGTNWGGDRAHSCAITILGKAYCWGRNAHGQLGDGSTTDSSIPVAVSTPERFTTLALMASSSCGLTEAQKVVCWGANDHGQLGQGNTTPSSIPLLVSGSYKTIASGMDAICAVQSASGALVCWGTRDRGSTTYIVDFSATTVDDMMPNVLSPTVFDSSRVYTTVAGGASNFCALSDARDAYCWGYEMYGRLGLGSQQFYAVFYTPNRVAGTTKFKAIGCGQSTTFAIDENDELWGWGKNEGGELGVGFVTTGSSPLPVEGPYGIYSPYKLDSVLKYSSLSVGDDFAFAVQK